MKATLARLRAELRNDRHAFTTRVEELRQLDLSRGDPGALAQAAVALHHGYGAVESALERVARSLEGSLPTGRDWHVALLENMALELEGIRPRILGDESLRLSRNLLAFRHFFRHAYAASLEAPRLDGLRADMLALAAVLERDLDALDAYLVGVASGSG